MRCSKCKDETYCSKECQTQHWFQSHKKWCGIPHGIEGRDWEVVHISSDKGMGVKALRPFEMDERIMVERMYPIREIVSSNGLTNEVLKLSPSDSDDLSLKYRINSIGSNDDRGSFGGLCVRMSRINHACDPSAVTYYDDGTKCMVLHASRKIAAGEEITISYTEFLDPTCGGYRSEYANHALNLADQYGIVCSAECACKGGAALDIKRRSVELEAEMIRLIGKEELIEVGMERVRFHRDSPLRMRFRVRLQLLSCALAMGVRLEGLKLYEIASALTRPDDATKYLG
jgi:hypothetical protein